MTAQRRFEIVVGVDLSEYSDIVAQHAFDEAIRHKRPSLHLLSVVPVHEGQWWRRPTETDLAVTEAEAKRRLAEFAVRVLDDAVPVDRRASWLVRLHVRRGRPEQQIVDLAAECFAGLIVVGRFGHAARERRGLGSIADRVVQFADCPVLVVGAGRETTASEQQCPDCVQIRAESEGERWFCERHHSDRLGHTTLLGDPLVRGGPMW